MQFFHLVHPLQKLVLELCTSLWCDFLPIFGSLGWLLLNLIHFLRLGVEVNEDVLFIFLPLFLFNDNGTKSLSRPRGNWLTWAGKRRQFIRFHPIQIVSLWVVMGGSSGGFVIKNIKCFFNGGKGFLFGGDERINWLQWWFIMRFFATGYFLGRGFLFALHVLYLIFIKI